MVSLDQIEFLNTPKQTAIILWGSWNDTTRKRIYRWITSGKLKAEKDGKRYWIPHKEIMKYISNEENAVTEAEIPSSNMNFGNG
tara:strand:+ start:772 stop:1023 length:252 start_codon:yes stop_codon:yes gene_type:complete